jgi:preprotein translocase subunit SecE
VADKDKKRGVARQTQQQNPLVRYFRETRGEMRKVVWPTREESIRLTAIVLAATAVFSVFLWLLDAGFSSVLGIIIDLLT